MDRHVAMETFVGVFGTGSFWPCVAWQLVITERTNPTME
jgi:hypothetical protein